MHKNFLHTLLSLWSKRNNFYSAEDYHQDYVTNNPENKYCQLVVAKKIQKFLSEFAHLLKDENLMDENLMDEAI